MKHFPLYIFLITQYEHCLVFLEMKCSRFVVFAVTFSHLSLIFEQQSLYQHQWMEGIAKDIL